MRLKIKCKAKRKLKNTFAFCLTFRPLPIQCKKIDINQKDITNSVDYRYGKDKKYFLVNFLTKCPDLRQNCRFIIEFVN